MTDFDSIWQIEDEIRTSVDAYARCAIWQLAYDAEIDAIRLELEVHLNEIEADELSSQFTRSNYYEGEGSHGSRYVFET